MGDLISARKRKALCNDADYDEAKRSRTLESPSVIPMHSEKVVADDFAARTLDDRILSSVEDTLVVPIEYIFREVPSLTEGSTSHVHSTPTAAGSRRQKSLLSRSEAQCLLKINSLAHEIDSLADVSTSALHQRMLWSSFAKSLQRTDHPHTRPLLPILHTLHERLPECTLQQVSLALNHRVVGELRRNVVLLRQCSEQNWTLAETLQDSAGDMGQVLAEEKRKLSDIQEEVCQRIENLLTHNNGGKRSSLQNEAHSNSACRRSEEISANTCSMKDYCDRIFEGHIAPTPSEEEFKDELLEKPSTNPFSAVTSPADTLPIPPATTPAPTTAVKYTSSNETTPIPAATKRTFQPQSLLELSSKRAGRGDEKENAQSPSSSQHSSQRTPGIEHVMAIATVAAMSPQSNDVVEDYDEDCFRSQGAAEVLSTLAATTRAAAAWGGEKSPTA